MTNPLDLPTPGGDTDVWGTKVNTALHQVQDESTSQVASEAGRAISAETFLDTKATTQIDTIANLLASQIPGLYTPAEGPVVTGQHRAYGGYDFIATADTYGQPPLPLGDASIADKAIVLAGAAGYARGATGGDAQPTFTVTINATSGAGSIGQAIADAKAAGGGYIIWDPSGGTAGTYTHAWPHGTSLVVPSNTTLNAHAANVTFTGFGYDDNTSFSIGGLDKAAFIANYGSTPANNIIVTGIKFNSNDGVADSHGDVVAIRWWSRNIWFDHCYFTNAQYLSDGLCDAVHTDSITYSWCEFYRHHKAVLNHSLPISNPAVNSPSGTDLPPGVTLGSPGAYTVQTESGTTQIATRATYVHCLFNGLAQRAPLVEQFTYGHVAGCWQRNFGTYDDGVNPPVFGLRNWPVVTGSRFAETLLPGPANGFTGTGATVVGAYVFNSGAASRIINKGHLLVEGTVYTLPGGSTGELAINEDGSGCHLRTSNNVYTNCTAVSDVDPTNATNPPYALALVPIADVPNAMRYGTGPGNGWNPTPWTLTGPATTGSSVLVQQEGTAIGGAKVINFTEAGIGTITFDSGTRTVTIPVSAGAVDPTTVLTWGTHAGRPAASIGNIGLAYFETDTTQIWQVKNATTWEQRTGPIVPVPVAGQMIAAVNYHPSGTQTSGQTTSTTLVDLSSITNVSAWTSFAAGMFDITFTAPANGNVEVQLHAGIQVTGSSADASYALYDTGAAALVTNTTFIVSNSTSKARPVYRKVVTGLTPGQSYTYRWQVKISAQTFNLLAGGANGPVHLRVYASL